MLRNFKMGRGSGWYGDGYPLGKEDEFFGELAKSVPPFRS
jgi:hypothetical protein